jgi:hypothetical protein
MKKERTSFLAWPALFVLSLFCYLYLSYAASASTGFSESSFAVTQEVENGSKEEQPGIVLPDIALLKKVLNLSKIVFEHP